MSLPDSAQRKGSRSSWLTPAIGLMIGFAYFIAGWLGDDKAFAIFGLALMVGTTAVFLLVEQGQRTFAGLLTGVTNALITSMRKRRRSQD